MWSFISSCPCYRSHISFLHQPFIYSFNSFIYSSRVLPSCGVLLWDAGIPLLPPVFLRAHCIVPSSLAAMDDVPIRAGVGRDGRPQTFEELLARKLPNTQHSTTASIVSDRFSPQSYSVLLL